jgi:hypothetical protein
MKKLFLTLLAFSNILMAQEQVADGHTKNVHQMSDEELEDTDRVNLSDFFEVYKSRDNEISESEAMQNMTSVFTTYIVAAIYSGKDLQLLLKKLNVFANKKKSKLTAEEITKLAAAINDGLNAEISKLTLQFSRAEHIELRDAISKIGTGESIDEKSIDAALKKANLVGPKLNLGKALIGLALLSESIGSFMAFTQNSKYSYPGVNAIKFGRHLSAEVGDLFDSEGWAKYGEQIRREAFGGKQEVPATTK